VTQSVGQINQKVYDDWRVIRRHYLWEGWCDAGEAAALLHVAPAVRGQPTLDIGVGGGRTVPLLKLLTDDYVGIDVAPAMVEACCERYPDVDVRLGDATNLSMFRDGQFGLAFFSFNGIDMLGHDDRARALAELYRVLRPGGHLVFSTLNRQGRTYLARPWNRGPARQGASTGFKAVRFLVQLAGNLRRYPLGAWARWFRLSRLAEDHGSWALAPLRAHDDFGLLAHWTTLAAAHDELRVAGYALEAAYSCEDGSVLDPARDVPGVRYFHLVARRS
jgi:SAM-dependent methyltransferase